MSHFINNKSGEMGEKTDRQAEREEEAMVTYRLNYYAVSNAG